LIQNSVTIAVVAIIAGKSILMSDSIQQEARQILDQLAFMPFEQCQPLSRDFGNIPGKVGLYAFRHRTEELLYIGKAKSLRDRLRGGDKAFL
jgi:hypothetical protein